MLASPTPSNEFLLALRSLVSGEYAKTRVNPTIEEGLKPALRSVCAATSIALPPDQDAGTPPGG